MHYGQGPRSCPSKTDPCVFVPDVIMNLSSPGLLLEAQSRALDGAMGIAVGTSEHFCQRIHRTLSMVPVS